MLSEDLGGFRERIAPCRPNPAASIELRANGGDEGGTRRERLQVSVVPVAETTLNAPATPAGKEYELARPLSAPSPAPAVSALGAPPLVLDHANDDRHPSSPRSSA